MIIGIGPDRVMHVEYETAPRPGLTRRMYKYRDRIMDAYPERRLTQHVIVLGGGRVSGHDDPATHGFSLVLNPVYLREHDPAEYLTDPFLALFAALARGSREQREQALGAAFRLIAGTGQQRTRVWLLCAAEVARIRLDRSTIVRIRRENIMSVDPFIESLREDEIGQALIKIGLEQGQAQGWEQGQAQAGERILLALIRIRFGDSSEARSAARMLGRWSDKEAAVAAITAAPDAASLLSLTPGTRP